MRFTEQKLIGLTIMVVLTLIWGGVVKSEAETRLTLRECIVLTLQNHAQIQMAEFQLQEALLELEKLNLEDPRGIARRELEEREHAVEAAHQALEETRMRLGLEVESGYYQLLKTRETLKNKEESLEWTQRQMEIVQIKYANGMIPEKDFLAMQDQLTGAEKNLTNMQYDYETARMEFNLTMGLELEYAFQLSEEQFPFEPVEVTLEETLVYALEHAVPLLQARSALDEVKAALELKRINSVSQLELLKAEHALIKAETAVKEAEKQMVITIRSTHMGLGSGHERVISAEKQCREVAEELEISRIKYEAGMIPLLEMMAAHKRLREAETQAIQAIYDYNLAKASFNRTIGKGYSFYEEIKAENQGSDQ